MPDTAIAAQVNPPSLSSLSSILGIQQQRQALQIGAQELAQKSLATQASTDVRDFFTDWSPGDHIASDGTVDIESAHQSPNYKALSGLAKTQADEKLISIKQGQIQNASSLLGLTREQLGVGAQLLGSVKQDPDVIAGNDNGKAKLNAAIDQWGQLGGPAGAKVAQIYQGITNGTPKTGELPQRIEALQKAALNADRQLQITQPGGATVQTTRGVQQVNVNPYAGPQYPVGSNVGGAVVNTPPPQIFTYPGGNPGIVGGPQGAQGTGRGAYPGPMPTDQDLTRHNAYEANLNTRVQVGSDAQPLITETEEALKAIRNGAGSSTRAKIAQTLQAWNAPKELIDAVNQGDLGKTQLAEKQMFLQTLIGLRQGMQGDPAHVAEFSEAAKVFPNIDTDPEAKRKLMGFISDRADRDYAEQQALNAAKKSGQFNPATWQGDYQQALRAGNVPGTPRGQIPQSSAGSTPKTGEVSKTVNGKTYVKRDGKWYEQ